jgi:hypothetical protein
MREDVQTAENREDYRLRSFDGQKSTEITAAGDIEAGSGDTRFAQDGSETGDRSGSFDRAMSAASKNKISETRNQFSSPAGGAENTSPESIAPKPLRNGNGNGIGSSLSAAASGAQPLVDGAAASVSAAKTVEAQNGRETIDTAAGDESIAGVGQSGVSRDIASAGEKAIQQVSGARWIEYLDMEGSDVVTSLVRHAKFMIGAGQSSATIRLEPPSLGRMRLEIVTENAKVTGKITVESQEARTILQNGLQELKEQLGQSGLKVESFDVQVGHNDGTGGWANRENNESLKSSARTDDYGSGRRIVSVEQPEPEAPHRGRSLETGNLDLWV